MQHLWKKSTSSTTVGPCMAKSKELRVLHSWWVGGHQFAWTIGVVMLDSKKPMLHMGFLNLWIHCKALPSLAMVLQGRALCWSKNNGKPLWWQCSRRKWEWLTSWNWPCGDSSQLERSGDVLMKRKSRFAGLSWGSSRSFNDWGWVKELALTDRRRMKDRNCRVLHSGLKPS